MERKTMQFYHICLFSAFVTVVYGVCPAGWSSYKTKCFSLSRENETMPSSQVMCGIIGKQYGKFGRLAVVNDAATDQFLLNLIDASNQDSYWIGANDIVEEGKWVWESSLLQVSYTNWGKDQPNNRDGAEHCTAMRGKYFPFVGIQRTWTDDPCTDLNNYICEINQ